MCGGHDVADEQDHGNSAAFALTINTDVVQPSMGSNMTLNITLQRTGNGSEYPLDIDFFLDADRNITWAFNFVRSEEEYDSLARGIDDDEYYGGWMSGCSDSLGMVVTPSMDELERARRLDDDRRKGCMNFGPRDRFERGGGIRHTFRDQEPREAYHFTVDVPL